MSGLHSGANPDLIKTGLDEVFKPILEEKPLPNQATVLDTDIFKPRSTSNSAHISEEHGGTGLWEERSSDLANAKETTPTSKNKRTITVSNYAHSLPITKRFEDDEEWDVVMDDVRDMAWNARLTDEINGFGLFRNAFTTTYTNDGSTALISDTQATISGDTVDNKLTSALDPDSLNDGIVKMAEMLNQDGNVSGFQARTLLVPPKLFKHACEITDSALLADTAENNKNVFSYKFNLFVKTSPHLSAAAGGGDTPWFLLGKNHKIFRLKRQEVQTYYIPWNQSKNLTSYYIGEYRNNYFASSYEGVIGSLGTT